MGKRATVPWHAERKRVGLSQRCWHPLIPSWAPAWELSKQEEADGVRDWVLVSVSVFLDPDVPEAGSESRLLLLPFFFFFLLDSSLNSGLHGC
jgi:hypothetical protein